MWKKLLIFACGWFSYMLFAPWLLFVILPTPIARWWLEQYGRYIEYFVAPFIEVPM